jgi:hypothetical protein
VLLGFPLDGCWWRRSFFISNWLSGNWFGGLWLDAWRCGFWLNRTFSGAWYE